MMEKRRGIRRKGEKAENYYNNTGQICSGANVGGPVVAPVVGEYSTDEGV